MQVNPTADVLALTTQPTAAANVRVVAGNLAAVPLGALLQAVVTQVTPREAVLTVNGEALTVRPPTGLQTGEVLLARVPKGANGALELSAPPPVSVPKPQVAVQPAQVKVVDVLATLPDGRVAVRIDGEEQVATPAEPLAPGSRLLLEVARTPAGVTLRAPAESAALPADVATAIIRATPTADLATALKPLQAELATLTTAQPAKGETAVPPAVREAATTVQETLRALVPDEPRPLAATELQQLVENGGIHFEAKLARLVAEPEAVSTASVAAEPVSDLEPGAEVPLTARTEPARVTADSKADPKPTSSSAAAQLTPARVTAELSGDLKGDLLRLLQTAQELGVVSQVPAARAALDGIEARQASQVLAEATATPYTLQIPFPDAGAWRTLHLSVEREVPSLTADPDRASRFRMLMHVPLSELGDTWIDAGLSGGSFRASIYLDRPAVRERVSAAIPELRAELRNDGFGEVLLDVRPTEALPAAARAQSAAMTAGRPASTSVLDVRA